MVLDTGLVSYWKFNEASGNAADSKGSNTLANVNTAAYAAGKIANAVALIKASSQYLHITDASQSGLEPSAALSIALWFKLTIDGSGGIVFKQNTAGSFTNPGYGFSYNSGSHMLNFEYSDADISGHDTRTNSGSGSLNPGTGVWVHIAVTCDAATHTVLFYINGVLQTTTYLSTGSTSMANTDRDFMVGNRPDVSSLIDAAFDEMGFWNRVLTAAEVSELYNSGSGITYPFPVASVGADLLMAMM